MSHKPLESFMEGNLYVEPCSDEALEFLSFVTKTAERYNIEMGTATNKERQFVLEQAEELFKLHQFQKAAV